jgi:hypothetical protein
LTLLSPDSCTDTPPAAASRVVVRSVGVENSRSAPAEVERGALNCTSPEEMCAATRRCFVRGSSELSSMVMRLSGRTCSVVPSKNVISAAEPSPVRTRSLLRSAIARSALTHSNVPTVFTFTLPSRVVKRAVVTVAGGAGSTAPAAGALRLQK